MRGSGAVGRRPVARRCRVFVVAACCVYPAASGCVTTVPIKATGYDIDLRLDPETHRLSGRTRLSLRCAGPGLSREGPAAVEFALHPGLRVDHIGAEGVEIQSHSSHVAEASEEHPEDEEQPQSAPLMIHRVVIEPMPEEFALTFEYSGEVQQDVEAGEERGAIHNFLMAAHVGTEGIYLEPGGGWYPFPHRDPDAPPEGELAHYRLTADPVDGMELVAGAAFDPQASERTGRLVWRSTYPVDGMVLVGGPHEVKERQVGDVRVAVHYTSPTDEDARRVMDKHSDLFLEAAVAYLNRYQPLVGPYPFERFTIVENFFSSGFAFPQFTLLNAVLLQMGPKALKHGYLDHELLHSWWGNSIYVDPGDGNWCEALAAYGANLYGYVLDGDEQGARRHRRNCCNFLSRIKAEKDKPLGTFGREDGAGRGIGYSKGAMVFHMLARKIGQENFWAAIRQLTAQYTGQYATWDTLKTLFERQSGVDLDPFFQQWVRSGGAPNLKLLKAEWQDDTRTLAVTIDQGETSFALAVPLRVVYQDETWSDETIELDKRRCTVPLRLDRAPVSVVLDPDYHVFRKLRPAEVMPTTGTTRAGDKLLVVKPGEEVCPFYETVIEDFSGKEGSKEVTQRTAGDVTAGDLAAQSVLVLGEAVHNGQVQALLARTNCPITWTESGFRIENTAYDDPGHSVLCTVHHPDIPEGGVTVYYGNSEDALGRSDLLLFYGNSLVVFETTAKEAAGETKYESSVILRRDFESQEALDVAK